MDISPKKMYRWQINKWKNAWHYQLLQTCKLKPWDTAPYQNDQNFKIDNTKYKDAGRNVKWYGHFGKQFWPFLIKLNIYLSYNPLISLLSEYHISKWYVHAKSCVCVNSYRSIYNCPKGQITQKSSSWGMDKQTVVHPYDRTTVSNEKGPTTDMGSMDASQMHYAK